MTGASRVRRIRDATELLALTEPLEPQSTLVAAPLTTRGLGCHDRAWMVEDADGGPAGVVLLSRLCRDRWYAKPLVLREQAAPLLARVIDRSPARGVLGPEEHVGPLISHLRRAGRHRSMPWAWVPAPLPPPGVDLDPRTRVADPSDLGALVALYRTFRLDPIPTRHLGGVLARILDTGIVVVGEEEGGRLVAAMRGEARSRRYLLWGGLTVLPESRSRGLARAVIVRTHETTRACGLGYMVVRATGRAPREGRRTEYNPLLQRREHRRLGASGTWMMLNLRRRSNRRPVTVLRRAAYWVRRGGNT